MNEPWRGGLRPNFEEGVGSLVSVLEWSHSSLSDITEALERLNAVALKEEDLPSSVRVMLRAALLRRLFTDQIRYVNVAKDYVTLADCHRLTRSLIHPTDSHGRLGGKGAGLFLAWKIVERAQQEHEVLREVRVPRTWYISSDGLQSFIHHNNLEDVYDRKYRDIEEVRQQYPRVLQLFKSSPFPRELLTGLAMALDGLGERPLIVRSSSLLEDRTGAVFSGKYRSLFLANTGTKEERLYALREAVAEAYASVFGPDPIGYRAEQNLLDAHEEMGIMIQEVVGTPAGRYFLPAFSGVAFSHNELRWSPRIRREDGLVRLVPGLGTRAVDRLGNDYPILLSPGQPGLRVNTTADEVVRYSPRMVDVINLESGAFETVPLTGLLGECGNDIPLVRKIVSMVEDNRIHRAGGLAVDFGKSAAVATFEGLAAETPFLPRVATLLKVLREKLGSPVDVEFASDGSHFFLLQCRAQSRSSDYAPAPIPREIPRNRILFSAHRYVSNGRVPDLTHIVYVDPEAYAGLTELSQLQEVGRTVGRLNRLLPKRQFILIGPGRWGNREDIRLGVSVTYSDLCNTAVLVEIARRRGSYVPDLSFGTHFFQDLVEAGIRYLPLYPDEEGSLFNEIFFRKTRNILPSLLPEFAHLESTVRVIDVAAEADGQVLRVLLNADLNEGVGYLTEAGQAPAGGEGPRGPSGQLTPREPTSDDHWRWRLRMAEQVALQLDANRFGVADMWIFGSTKNATAGPGSDIDLLVHFRGTKEQRKELLLWLEGWSLSLAEANYLRTGYRSEGLLDVHLITDEDIERKSSYAMKIHAVTDPARPLRLGGGSKSRDN